MSRWVVSVHFEVFVLNFMCLSLHKTRKPRNPFMFARPKRRFATQTAHSLPHRHSHSLKNCMTRGTRRIFFITFRTEKQE